MIVGVAFLSAGLALSYWLAVEADNGAEFIGWSLIMVACAVALALVTT